MTSESLRTVPMQVLCLGYGRTGTISLRLALQTLGFNHAYHTFDTVTTRQSDCEFWISALTAKHDGIGTIPGRHEFDTIFSDCRAVLDMPAAYFAEELIAAYPEAKVILTVREVDSWFVSVRNTLVRAQSNIGMRIASFLDTILLMPTRHRHRMFAKGDSVIYGPDFEVTAKQTYLAHNEKVRSLVPPGRLLEYHVKQGWAPLCAFLEKAVPDEPMPRTNSAQDFNAMIDNENKTLFLAQAKRVLDLVAYTTLVTVLTRSIWRQFRF